MSFSKNKTNFHKTRNFASIGDSFVGGHALKGSLTTWLGKKLEHTTFISFQAIVNY